MKTLIIYTSQTGFTKKYAQWLAEKTNGEVLELKEAKKKDEAFFDEYQAIAYGGWAVAEKVAQVDWFLGKVSGWKEKRLAIFVVGANVSDSPMTQKMLDGVLTAEQKSYVKIFYCQGGLCYEKLNLPNRLAMKAFASMLKKKKDATEELKQMGELISNSFDASDEKYVEPISEWLQGAQGWF